MKGFRVALPDEAGTHYYHARLGCVLTWEVVLTLGVQGDCMLPMVAVRG